MQYAGIWTGGIQDYARLGLPLSLLVIVIGTPLIVWPWPIR
jgi:hypothetical protein